MGDASRTTSGTDGLDEVLDGGFIEGQTAIVSGGPGTGKTVLALQFLAAADNGLYIGFEERETDIRENAARLGIDLSTVEILDLSAQGSRFFGSDDEYTIFPHEEVEGEELLDSIAAAIDEEAPPRRLPVPTQHLLARERAQDARHHDGVYDSGGRRDERLGPPVSRRRDHRHPTYDRPPVTGGDEVSRLGLRQRQTHLPDSGRLRWAGVSEARPR
ncbi:hypothetical protein BRD20_03550 [Halobacteriales archaeon SW_8_65_20]|nr:MAG: hypothetical protein BRD20_03550 [Halobacteriales archaeon SW_8_65_20]